MTVAKMLQLYCVLHSVTLIEQRIGNDALGGCSYFVGHGRLGRNVFDTEHMPCYNDCQIIIGSVKITELQQSVY